MEIGSRELVTKLAKRPREDLLNVVDVEPGYLSDLSAGEVASEPERKDLSLALGEAVKR